MDTHASSSGDVGRNLDDNPDNFQVVPSTPSSEITEDPILAAATEAALQHRREVEEEDEQEPEPFEWPPAVLVVARAVKKMVTPILRVLFAPKAQRTLIKSTAMVIVFLMILTTSIGAYLTFYRQYVPQTAHIEPIFFQYDQQVEGPTDRIDLTRGQPYTPLRHEQTYDVSVQLHVPTSDINFDLGNFMIRIWLQTSNGSSILHSSRPGILRYQSKTQRIMRVLAKALPLLVGLSEESQTITVPLIEGFMENKAHPVTHAIVSVSTHQLQVYDADLRVIADFHGLRYYMYHRRLVTAIGFVILFTVIEIICAAVAWKFFGQNLWNKVHEALEQMDFEDGGQLHPDDVDDINHHQQPPNDDDDNDEHSKKKGSILDDEYPATEAPVTSASTHDH
ncbi:hypothetical protein O0I10_002956 [Lichtheimia ornata]|uniref:Seipin n=1 Tax=Lichtheimia ornata TaxID=688661 RepID=A0AAD7Y2L2_9FUNG|nr:uncharacterized protein O0I10_002956 [Lichtheimia ornata]KAJ8661207.1 hypothetical protein O0I10_002956 [Lichtheimia ornata]